ncbi:HET-domain-containing protein [Xylariaceae sp. AK1471]|nr:HET-domain-containing protein [Xylariaceae sp. AK1471]
MEFQCEHCAKLSISYLIEVAKQGSHMKPCLHKHHASLSDLEASAQQGCSLCQLIITYLHGAEHVVGRSLHEILPWTGSVIDNEKSAYSFARNLPNSQIRLWFLCFPDDQVLDRLYVKIGSVDDRDVTNSLATLVLALKTPRDKPSYVKNYRVGRYQLDPDLSSLGNMSIAREWLRVCRGQHPDCLTVRSNILPTRIIDVGPADGSGALHLVSGEGLKAEYVALSHCWGGPITPVLEASTLETFRNVIPIATLPPNFRDAITITRELECKKMMDVYRNAVVTISASASLGSEHGILRAAQASASALNAPKQVRIRIFPEHDMVQDRICVEIEDSNEEDLERLDSEGPLALRGWTLQESILSSRQLFFGTRQIYWRCQKGYECAEGGSLLGSFRQPNYLYDVSRPMMHREVGKTETARVGISNTGQDSHNTDSGGLKVWEDRRDVTFEIAGNEYYKMVEQYSRRRLTVASDKLPAFSGLAQALRGAFEDCSLSSYSALEPNSSIYLAGLWATDLCRGLAWWRYKHSFRPHTPVYRAPSWSWASTDGPVEFWKLVEHTELDLRLLNYRVKLRDLENPFGEITYAELVVCGRAKKLRQSMEVSMSSSSYDHIGFCHFDDEEIQRCSEHPKSRLYRAQGQDNIIFASSQGDRADVSKFDQSCNSPSEYVVLLLGLFYTTPDDKESVAAYCLVVRPQHEDKEVRYERVGFTNLSGQIKDWINSWEIMTMKLV